MSLVLGIVQHRWPKGVVQFLALLTAIMGSDG